LAKLAHLPLEDLDLSCTQITGSTLDRFGRLQKLKLKSCAQVKDQLSLPGQVTHLDLSGSAHVCVESLPPSITQLRATCCSLNLVNLDLPRLEVLLVDESQPLSNQELARLFPHARVQRVVTPKAG
jgi:hypothetical protein